MQKNHKVCTCQPVAKTPMGKVGFDFIFIWFSSVCNLKQLLRNTLIQMQSSGSTQPCNKKPAASDVTPHNLNTDYTDSDLGFVNN